MINFVPLRDLDLPMMHKQIDGLKQFRAQMVFNMMASSGLTIPICFEVSHSLVTALVTIWFLCSAFWGYRTSAQLKAARKKHEHAMWSNTCRYDVTEVSAKPSVMVEWLVNNNIPVNMCGYWVDSSNKKNEVPEVCEDFDPIIWGVIIQFGKDYLSNYSRYRFEEHFF